jgi:hypothetical protein
MPSSPFSLIKKNDTKESLFICSTFQNAFIFSGSVIIIIYFSWNVIIENCSIFSFLCSVLQIIALLYFFLLAIVCLSFDLRILITLLVSSNSYLINIILLTPLSSLIKTTAFLCLYNNSASNILVSLVSFSNLCLR